MKQKHQEVPQLYHCTHSWESVNPGKVVVDRWQDIDAGPVMRRLVCSLAVQSPLWTGGLTSTGYNPGPNVMRVYRDLAGPGYTSGLEKFPDDMRELAQENGWDGPWEITTLGELIEEVVKNQDTPLEYLSKVPQEEGARGKNLHFWTTGLNAWGKTGAKTR